MKEEVRRGDWATHYHSFDGQDVTPAITPSKRCVQDGAKMRWPWAPRPDMVSRIRAEKPACAPQMFLMALPTLYPAYVEAILVAAFGEPRTEKERAEYRAAYTLLMMAKEGVYLGEALGTPRTTRYGGTWYIGRHPINDFLNGPALAKGQALLRLTSLGFPPAEQVLWAHRFVFDSARKASFAEQDRSRSGTIGVYLATFPDTLLAGEVLLEGGPSNGFLALQNHFQSHRAAWQATLDALRVPGKVYLDSVQDGPGCRMLTHWAIEQPLRTRNAEVEIVYRFVAHNLIEQIRLAFARRSLPDFDNAVRAIKEGLQ